jgi:hypothetical protein
MISFILFLLCLLAMAAGVGALVIWVALAIVEAFLTCTERALKGFTNGHAIVAILYAVLGAWFAYLIGYGGSLAYSFVTEVFLR